MKHLKFILIISAAGAAAAQTASPVSLNLVLSLVSTVKVNGKATEQLTANPKTTLPGDVISQVVTVRNSSDKTVRQFPVTLPVPKDTRYLNMEKELDGAQAQYSIDGGKTFAPAPLKRRVTVTENGKSVTRDVTVNPNEYTTVRWTVSELSPNGTLKLGYRVQVK
ncbi:hypothetical protein [Deinococcus radiotolerans]|uniref:DUF11 domain-containing protein n=1 Tax=Deinococcus radiotolerans TaxID=1309407 RepID=A0ABQ2FKR0_9DEIO|nr:hypothetical protein [Deinococcus radiotolerans]GGL03897.1 hypothetical protein GCM10010844_23150 [Deinococcus radiotolerans]